MRTRQYMLALAAFACVAGIHPCLGADPGWDPYDQPLLPYGTQIPFRLTGQVTSMRGGGDDAALEVLNDITVQDLVVVPKGARGLFSIARKDAVRWRFLQPGRLRLDINGVISITGLVIPLHGSYEISGEAPCVEEDCFFLPLFAWMKGDQARVKEQSLVAGMVSRDVTFNRSLLERLNSRLANKGQVDLYKSSARVHLYRPGTDTADGWNGSTFCVMRVDNKNIGSLEDAHYGCLDLSAGTHVIRAAGFELILDVEDGQDYYIRVGEGGGDLVAERTGDYVLGKSMLLPSSNLKKCFSTVLQAPVP